MANYCEKEAVNKSAASAASPDDMKCQLPDQVNCWPSLPVLGQKKGNTKGRSTA